MIRGAIFDFDGTLFDTMEIWETAGERYLRSVGAEPPAGLCELLRPMSIPQAAKYCRETFSLPFSEAEVTEGILSVVRDFYLFSAPPKPGAKDFLAILKEKGVKMCVATASDRELVGAALKRCGMDGFFSAVVTCAELDCGKAEPTVFRAAAERLGTEKAETVVFEDTAAALSAAKADGFPTVGVYDRFSRPPEAAKAVCDCWLTDFLHTEGFFAFAFSGLRKENG